MAPQPFWAREISADEEVLAAEVAGAQPAHHVAKLLHPVLKLTAPKGFDWSEVTSQVGDAVTWTQGARDTVLLSSTREALGDLARRLGAMWPELAEAIVSALRTRSPNALEARGRSLPLGERTLVMGILNVSPDSFSGDGLRALDDTVAQARRFLEAGADMLDIGAMSTRPGSAPIPQELEAQRLHEAISALRGLTPALISADTYRPRPASVALEAGADLINDITGLRHPRIAELAASYDAGVVVMHMQGTPATMQLAPRYEDVVGEVYWALADGVVTARRAGIPPAGIIVDPGIGFGKTLEHNLELLRRLRELKGLGHALLVGTSRKGFIGKITGREVHDRLEGTAATVALSVAGGADIVRVHDVEQMALVCKMADAIVRPHAGSRFEVGARA